MNLNYSVVMKIIRDVEQGTPEWHEYRRTRMTASHAQEIATADKGLQTLCRKIAGQIYTGELAPCAFKNQNMITGNEEECFAREAYELTQGVDVEQIGIGLYSDYVGASPDGLIGDDGGCEFKRKTFEKHNDLLLGAEKFESKYVWQCHMNMLVFDRQWWDLVSYNPLFKDRSLYIQRIYRDPAKDALLLNGFKVGEELIKAYLNELQTPIKTIQQ